MSDNWKINKWAEDLTPRRAIQNFFLHATPVDSPDPGQLAEIDPVSTNESKSGTPLAGSSQSSQLGPVALKRKLDQHESLEGNLSKRSNLEESHQFQGDSLSSLSELPSQLPSPSVVVPARPAMKVKRRMSMTAFTQAILSQESQKSQKEEHSDFLDESSGIPSALGSPDQTLSQRPKKTKTRVSVSAFTETLKDKGSKDITISGEISGSESSEIPSTLDSPEVVTSQRPLTGKEKRRVSSTGFKKILNQQPLLISYSESDDDNNGNLEEKSIVPASIESNHALTSESSQTSRESPQDPSKIISRSSENEKNKSVDLVSAENISAQFVDAPKDNVTLTLDTESVAENDRKQVEEVSAMFGLGKRSLRESLRLSRKSLLSASSPIAEANSLQSKDSPTVSSLTRNRSVEMPKLDPVLGQENTELASVNSIENLSKSLKDDILNNLPSNSDTEDDQENKKVRASKEPTNKSQLSNTTRGMSSTEDIPAELVEAQEVEETPPSDLDSAEEDEVMDEDEEDVEKLEEIEKADDVPELSEFGMRSSRESARSSRKPDRTTMSPTNRYPALKNSTVVDGGQSFLGAPLGMSPIKLAEKETPSSVQSIPLTPIPSSRKVTRSVPQSPMFMNVMQKAITKTARELMEQASPIAAPTSSETIGRKSSIAQKTINKTSRDSKEQATPTVSSSSKTISRKSSIVQKTMNRTSRELKEQATLAGSTPSVTVGKKTASPRNVTIHKGSSLPNPVKGKSLLLTVADDQSETSDTEWEDLDDETEKSNPLAIKIANEAIPNQTKNYIPLEQRLKADPIFIAKVKSQKAKIAAQKASEDAVAAKGKLAASKPRATAAQKKQADNVANVATNKANLRFYARSKVTKDALESIHDLVSEWFDFTLDQMENFCIDEGKQSIDTWEDSIKMLRRQRIVKNYWDYSGLVHELLLNDEAAKLLPSEFPPGHHDDVREAKRRRKRDQL